MKKQKSSVAKFYMVTSFIFVILLSISTIFAAGEVDAGFKASAYGVPEDGNVYVIKKQSDGKVLVGGLFTVVNGYARSGLVRLNADETVDTSFNPPDFMGIWGLGVSVHALGIQSDGKIIVGGDFTHITGDNTHGVKRLHPDGTLDRTFDGVFFGDQTYEVYDIEVLPDDKIIIGGRFRFPWDFDYENIARLNADGTRDNSFQAAHNAVAVKDLEIQKDGKIVAGGVNFLSRVNSDGTTDTSFISGSVGGTIEAVETRGDGKILIAGSFTNINGFPQGRLSLLNPDGSIDFNFNLNGVGTNGTIYDVLIKPDGKIIIGGLFTNFNSVVRKNIAQLNADGTLDTPFPNGSILNPVNILEILSDGKILVGTNFVFTLPSLYKFNPDGTRDESVNFIFARRGVVRDILPQPDGKILIAGYYFYSGAAARRGLVRVNPDGSLDTTFISDFSIISYALNSIDLQPDGKIIVGAGNPRDRLKRLNSDGSLDTSFNVQGFNNSTVNDIAIQPDGKIIAGGNFNSSGNPRIFRFNSDGSRDLTFPAAQPNGEVRKVILQPDGKILIAGDFTQVGAIFRGRIARFNADGSLDTTFSPPGGANGIIHAMDLQSDGKIVVGGVFTSLNGNNNTKKIGRYNPDGTLDASFIQTVDVDVFTVKVQPDGKILIGGSIYTVGNVENNRIARLNANGSVDPTFMAAPNDYVRTINLQADGKILLGGDFTKINQLSNVGIGRLLNNLNAVQRTPFDFDGDSRSDIAVFRSSTNRWYEFLSSNSQVVETTFGIADDIIAPADFDGDGKTDLAIFRPSSGNWWYLSSIDNTQKSVQFGASGDIPRPSDFDGDGIDDFIVFRPSNSTWYRLGSSGEVSIVTFGTTGDKPLTGDFDGDGKSDLAIYRPSTGDWWRRSSIDGIFRATHWGNDTDLPVPADYDGDGVTDLAVYRPSTGVWYILNSSTGQATIVGFGLAEDKPVAADYDGDGRSDIAVYRPSTGVWYLLRTTDGFTAFQFGISTDIPIPNAFIQ